MPLFAGTFRPIQSSTSEVPHGNKEAGRDPPSVPAKVIDKCGNREVVQRCPQGFDFIAQEAARTCCQCLRSEQRFPDLCRGRKRWVEVTQGQKVRHQRSQGLTLFPHRIAKNHRPGPAPNGPFFGQRPLMGEGEDAIVLSCPGDPRKALSTAPAAVVRFARAEATADRNLCSSPSPPEASTLEAFRLREEPRKDPAL